MKSPPGDECTVAHVSLLYLVAFLDTGGLSEQTVHQICIILCLVGFCVGKESQFHQLFIGHIIQAEKVGTCFLDGIAVSLEGIRVGSWQQLTAAVSQAFMQVGMLVVRKVGILLYHGESILVDDKLLVESVAMSSLIVRLGQISYRDTL